MIMIMVLILLTMVIILIIGAVETGVVKEEDRQAMQDLTYIA